MLNLKLAECGLTSRYLEDINFPPGLEKLDLSSNEITFIDAKFCSRNRKLFIDLSKNNISELTTKSFGEGCSVHELLLTKNPIHTVEPYLITLLRVETLSVDGYPLTDMALNNLTLGVSTSVIERLIISSTGITHIPPGLFEPLQNKSMKHLSLAYNSLVLYKFVFANLTLLSRLDLQGCGLLTLDPDYFSGMKNLRYFNLFLNYFDTLNPSNTTWNVNLQHLTISMSSSPEEITPFTFKGLDHLTELMMSHDVGIHTTQGTFELIHLTKFSLLGHPFHTIILRSPALKYFQCRMMERRYARFMIFYEFQNSPLLEVLRLDNGGLGEFSELYLDLNFTSPLQRLMLLDLSFNYIGKLFSCLFKHLPSLQVLYINNNKIKEIESGAFSGLINLRVLDLRSNEIILLPDDIFKDLGALTNLRLDINALSYLNADIFQSSPTLTNLTLANNRLVSFNKSTFEPIFASLKLLDISENVLVCNCDCKWLHQIKKLAGHLVNTCTDKTLCSTSSATLGAMRGKAVGLFNANKYCTVNIVRYCSIISSILILSAIAVICYHHRWLLRYKLFLLKLAILGYKEVHDARDKDDFEYHINVMFMENDEEWAIENFRPALEERFPNYGRIAFGDDELRLGMHYFDAVYYNVENSFKTILLLSRAAVQDHIFMTKLRIAMNHVTDTETDNLILVFIEEIPDQELPHLVRLHLSGQGAYLSWEEDEEGQEYFWNKLKKHMNVNLKVNHMIPAD